MLSPVEDVNSWCERHGISLKPVNCIKCKKELHFKIPIAIKKYRGVSCDEKDHECGKKYTPFRVVPVGKEEIEIWNNLRGI